MSFRILLYCDLFLCCLSNVLISTVPQYAIDENRSDYSNLKAQNHGNNYTSFLNCVGPTLKGLVIQQNDAEYSTFKNGNMARVNRHPLAVLPLSSAEDLPLVLKCAFAFGIKVVPRGGTHSYESLSSMDGQLVVDMRGLNNTVLDVASQTATIQSGALLGYVYTDLFNQGQLADASNQISFNAGSCPSVGVGGHFLGGGKGFQSRTYGLAADRILEIDAVLANGTALTASEGTHSDLFWALRGGASGSFAVVTSYKVQTYNQKQNSVFTLYFGTDDLASASSVLDNWQQYWTGSVAPREVTSIVMLFGPAIQVQGQYFGSADEASSWIESTGIKYLSSFQTIELFECSALGARAYVWYYNGNSCSNTYILTDPSITTVDYGKYKSDYLDNFLSVGVLQDLISLVKNNPYGSSSYDAYIQFYSMGGALADYNETATPFVARNALFNLQYKINLDQGECRVNQADDNFTKECKANDPRYQWIASLESYLSNYTTGQKYQNYPDLDLGDDYGVAYFGQENYFRLQQIKQQYDPTNFFVNTQSIPLPSARV